MGQCKEQVSQWGNRIAVKDLILQLYEFKWFSDNPVRYQIIETFDNSTNTYNIENLTCVEDGRGDNKVLNLSYKETPIVEKSIIDIRYSAYEKEAKYIAKIFLPYGTIEIRTNH